MWLNTAEAGTDGAVANATNTGGLSGDAFTILGTAPPTFTTTSKRGTLGYKTPSGSAQGALYWQFPTARQAVTTQMWVRLSAYPAVDSRILDFRDTTPSTVGGLLLNTNGTIRLMQLTSGIGATASPALTLNTWYCVNFWVNNTSSGSYAIQILNADGSTFHSYSGTFTSTAVAISQVRFGRPAVVDMNGGFYFDDIRAEENRMTFITEAIDDPAGAGLAGTSIWNGSTEVSGTTTIWNGVTELTPLRVDVFPEKPNATNTGVPAGTSLTIQTADITYSTNGQTIQNMDFACHVNVTGTNVIFKNCKFRGKGTTYVSLTNGYLVWSRAAGVTFDHCTFEHDNPVWWAGSLGGSNFTVRYCNFSAGVDGIMVRYGEPTTIEYNYFHDFFFSDQCEDQASSNPPYWTHNDGVQYRVGSAGGPHVLRGNNFEWYPGEGAKFTRNAVLETGAAGTSYPRSLRSPKTGRLLWGAAVTVSPDFGPWPSNLLMEYNWMDGGTACFQALTTTASGDFTVGTIRSNMVGHDQYSYNAVSDDSYQLRWNAPFGVLEYLNSNLWDTSDTVTDSTKRWTYLTSGFSGGIRIS